MIHLLDHSMQLGLVKSESKTLRDRFWRCQTSWRLDLLHDLVNNHGLFLIVLGPLLPLNDLLNDGLACPTLALLRRHSLVVLKAILVARAIHLLVR